MGKPPAKSGCRTTNGFSMKHAAGSGVGNAFTCQASLQIESLAIDLGANPMKFLSLLVLSLSVFAFSPRRQRRGNRSFGESGCAPAGTFPLLRQAIIQSANWRCSA